MNEEGSIMNKGLTKRRVGDFAVGCFALFCAALVPRLATIFAQQPTSERVEAISVLTWTFNWAFLGPVIVLAGLVGGIVVVLKWDHLSSPAEIFMAALAVPALVTGAVNGNLLTSNVAVLTDQSSALADQLANAAGIPVDHDASSGEAPNQGWELSLLPSAFANDGKAAMAQSDSATRFRQLRYWIVLETADTKLEAESAAERMDSEYGKVTVQEIKQKYHVVLGDSPYPYATAVSKAVDVKRKSNSAIQPRLTRAPTARE